MTASSLLARSVILASVLGSLALSHPKPAAAETIDTHAYWSSVANMTDKGETLCGVRTDMRNGGQLQLFVYANDVHLVARDPGWNLRSDGLVRVTLMIDGEGYRGQARAIDGQTLLIQGVSRDFLESFVDGSMMVADFGGVRWNVDLSGSAQATDDLIACVNQARPGYSS